MLHWLYRLADRARDRARRKKWPADKAVGRWGEDLAHRFLQRHGYIVVARNYRIPDGSGEIDLIAWDGPSLVFVEVKTRTGDEFASPLRNVDSRKLDKLVHTAAHYLRRSGNSWNCVRFDAVSVVLGEPPRIELLRDLMPVLLR